jgi:hypothetical protein
MEMEKAYYVVVPRPSFIDLIRSIRVEDGDQSDVSPHTFVVAITQGGFGQDVVDADRQTKERFLEHLFYSSGIDLPRTTEAFDVYFELKTADEFIDLDEEPV